MIITEKQMRELEKLANAGYGEVLVAYGADMYREGLIKGVATATIATISIALGVIFTTSVKNIKNKKSQMKSMKES